ncbi:Mob1/phocein [Russula aff. rugulosa BPL654]|nr:Mob1/phocein [Russula aff. rugulosa BPL654]
MATAVQRPLKGSRISTFYPVKNLPALATLDSAFQLQEFISLTIRSNIHDVQAIVSIPDTRNEPDGDKDVRNDFAVDEACWIYEQLRRLAQDLSHPLITMLQQECTRATCPEMKAGEWMYLCVAHGNDGAMEQCCAIDYILHTVDSATALLNSPRAFPSRINIPTPSHRHFGSLARRLGRIFAHAYFHHREVFEQAEAESSLYARFLALTFKFDLVPAEFLIIPTASGLSDEPELPRLHAAAVDPLHQSGSDDENDDRGRGTHRGLGMDILGGIDRNPSPRKGRSRTGTMIFSEALIMADELSKGGGSPSPERGSGVQIPTMSTEPQESEGDFVHVDVSSRGEKEEEHHEEEEHESHLDLPAEEEKDDYGMRDPLSDEESPDEEEEEEKSDFGMDDPLEEDEEHVLTLSEMHTHVEDIQDHHAPEQDVTDDPEDSVEEHDDEAPEHDVTSAHETSGTTIIELPPAEDIDALEDAQEEDLTEAVVEPQYEEEDDSADAQEVAEQIALDEPHHDQPAAT